MFYALRHKEDHKRWVGIMTQSHDSDFCNSVTATFEFEEEIPFITNKIEVLEAIKRHAKTVDWFNSSEQNPELCDYDIKRKIADQFEIVELGVV